MSRDGQASGILGDSVPGEGIACEVLAAADARGHEQVVFCRDAASGLRAIIAIHSTALGPSLGGTRFYPFPSESAALVDVLRLSRAMTYKSAAAGLDLGGGKAVVIGDPRHDKSDARLRAYARFVDSLGGRYYTTEDVGTTEADMEVISQETRYVTGRSREAGGSGDPSPATAVGVYEAMRAAARHLWGEPDLDGRKIVVSGVGKVGSALVSHLLDAGCRVMVADVNLDAVAALGDAVTSVEVEKAHAVECDVFSPCALGGVLNPTTIPELQCQAVVGSANNQLDTSESGELLHRSGVLYVPDYVANAGGVVNIAFEMGREYDWKDAEAAVRRIFDNTTTVLETAARDNISTAAAADRVAEQRVADEERTGLPPLNQ